MSQYIDIVTSVVQLFGEPVETHQVGEKGTFDSNTLSFTDDYAVVSELNGRTVRMVRYTITDTAAIYAVRVIGADSELLYSSLISTTAQKQSDLLADTDQLLSHIGIELGLVFTPETGWCPGIFVQDKNSSSSPFVWIADDHSSSIVEVISFEDDGSKAVHATDKAALENMVPSSIVSGLNIWDWEGFMDYDVSTVQL